MKNLFVIISILLFSLTFSQSKKVTWYDLHGNKTASGKIFDRDGMTCASNTHKFGTKLKVTNVENGKSVVCTVTDRGAFTKHGVALDLSKGAFKVIAALRQGIAWVSIEVLQ